MGGSKTEAKPPCAGKYKTPQGSLKTVDFHYSVDIDEHEQQYVTSLANWTALRIVQKTKLTKPSIAQGKVAYPLYFNGHEKWYAVPQQSWNCGPSPEDLGIGHLVDEVGFFSKSRHRDRQTEVLVQGMNGVVLPAMRSARTASLALEDAIQGELQRLSSLWTTF